MRTGTCPPAVWRKKENYELDLNGTVQLDWTAEEMAKATDVESLLEEENEQ